MTSRTLAIDFGTSNSAAALIGPGGRPWHIPIENGASTLPTAVFFPGRGGEMRIGTAAAEALIGGAEGRYMRALKSVLGTPLLQEERLIAGKRRSIAAIITAFLAELRQRAEATTGLRFSHALSGRPVHFHSRNPALDAQAEADLRGCYLAAGFDDVSFLAEPEAAAIASHQMHRAGGLGLVVDIGGGTSDFTVFATEGGRARILASHGIRLGGTDFDHAVSMAHAMPVLGHGGTLRREMGQGLLPVPNSIYVELSTWAKIPFLYTPESLRLAKSMLRSATDRDGMARLVSVLEEELGHELAFAVERGKIAANGGGDGRIAMQFVERGLSVPVSPASLDACLQGYRKELREAAAETLALAGVSAAEIGSVVLVGGSSLMELVAVEAQVLCPAAELLRSEAFTAVVDGLAIAAAER